MNLHVKNYPSKLLKIATKLQESPSASTRHLGIDIAIAVNLMAPNDDVHGEELIHLDFDRDECFILDAAGIKL